MRYFFISVFAEGFGRHPIDLLKQLIEIGYGGEAYIVTHGQDGVVGVLQLEGSLLQADPVQILRHGVAGVLPETAAQIGFVEVEGLQNVVQPHLQKFIHVEAAQKLPEPHGVVGVVVADPFFHKQVQQGNTQRPGGGQAVLGVHAGGQNGIGDPVLVGLHLVQGQGQHLRQMIALIGLFEIVAQEGADRIEKFCVYDNIPVLTGIAFLTNKAVDVLQIQKNHIAGVQDTGFTIEHVGDRTLQHIEDLVELMTVYNIVAVLGDFGVKRMLRRGHPIVQNAVTHDPVSPLLSVLYTHWRRRIKTKPANRSI